MKVAIVGSRGFDDYELLIEKIDEIRNMYGISQIISGGANGADTLGEKYAREYEIPMWVIYPDWNIGRHAGMLRNTDIVANADIVVAFWDGSSAGTKDSIRKAKRMNKHLIVVKY